MGRTLKDCLLDGRVAGTRFVDARGKIYRAEDLDGISIIGMYEGKTEQEHLRLADHLNDSLYTINPSNSHHNQHDN